MAYIGPEKAADALANLDEKQLVRLVRDILANRGHETVRITDGPGDATRDVFSMTPQKERHLAQCKFHQETSKAWSTREVAELPLGLIKHGYRRGLFVTNAEITAPGKRELLDNYPDLELEFMTGDDLVAEVLGSDVLQAIWYDGISITNVNSRMTFPILVRMHEFDHPLSPAEYNSPAKSFLAAAAERAFRTLAPIAYGTGAAMAWYPDSFEPYRYPTARNYVEGAHSTFQVLSLSTLGATSYADALSIAVAVGSELAEVVAENLGGATVVVGRPALEKTHGDFSIKKMLLPIDPARVVGVPGECLPEAKWYACDGSNWSSDTDARVTEMPVVRLYHLELDVCTSYEIKSPLTPFQEMGRQRHKRSWEAAPTPYCRQT